MLAQAKLFFKICNQDISQKLTATTSRKFKISYFQMINDKKLYVYWYKCELISKPEQEP